MLREIAPPIFEASYQSEVRSANPRIPLLTTLALTVFAVLIGHLPRAGLFDNPLSYVPLHTAMEFVAIVVMAMVCGLCWNLQGMRYNSKAIILSAAFFLGAAFDLLHIFSFPGMPDLVTPSGTEKAIYFWISAQLACAAGIFLMAIFPSKKWGRRSIIFSISLSLIVLLLVTWIVLFNQVWLPQAFDDEAGLTKIKVYSEYAIIALFILSSVKLASEARRSRAQAPYWLAASAWILAVGESFFTSYAAITDLDHLFGHLYKIVAFVMIYRSIFVEGVHAPYIALDFERSYLKSLLSTIPDLVWLKSKDGIYLACNPQFERFFGASEAEIVGKTDYDFVDADLATFFRDKDKAAMAADRPLHNEEWVTFAADGHRAFLETKKTRMQGDDGRLIGVLGIARDMTARFKTEQTLRKANDDLEQFAQIAAHDLREPLRSISGFLALLEKRYSGKLDDDAHEFITFARESAERMNQMVLDLLEYTHTSEPTDTPSPVALSGVVLEALRRLDREIQQANAALSIADDLPVVQGSSDKLVRLIEHLISNAIKYRSADRPLRVVISGRHDDDGGWIISVEDNGMGIDAPYHDQIFDIFSRLHTRDKFGGTGIGLALCKKIIECYGGRIWVVSNPDYGVTFRFTLPGEMAAGEMAARKPQASA